MKNKGWGGGAYIYIFSRQEVTRTWESLIFNFWYHSSEKVFLFMQWSIL